MSLDFLRRDIYTNNSKNHEHNPKKIFRSVNLVHLTLALFMSTQNGNRIKQINSFK